MRTPIAPPTPAAHVRVRICALASPGYAFELYRAAAVTIIVWQINNK